MGKIIVVFMLQAALSIALLPWQAWAGDGDMNYSAPYITVDPETGQLVTKNPGPHLKMHSPDPSMQMQAVEPDTAATTVASQISAGGTDNISMPVSQQYRPVAIITLVSVGVIVFSLLAFRRLRQR